jgi:hypothetical protein
MKLSVLAFLFTLWASLLAGAWANDDDHGDDDDDDDHHHHHHHAQATPVQVGIFHKTPFPPPPQAEEPDDETPSLGITTGQPSGPISPSSPAININIMGGGNSNTNTTIPRTKRQRCGGNGIVFDSNTRTGLNGSPTAPSGAKAGEVIFATSNWLAAI